MKTNIIYTYFIIPSLEPEFEYLMDKNVGFIILIAIPTLSILYNSPTHVCYLAAVIYNSG